MRRIAFLIAIIGLSILLSLLLKQPTKISSLDGLLPGTAIEIQGTVDEERKFGSGKLIIINEIPIYCECSNKYIGSKVKVEGVIEKFPEDLRIRAFNIQIIS